MPRQLISPTIYLDDPFDLAANWTPSGGSWAATDGNHVESSATNGKKYSLSNAVMAKRAFKISYRVKYSVADGSGGGLHLRNNDNSKNLRIQHFPSGTLSVYVNPGTGDVEYAVSQAIALDTWYEVKFVMRNGFFDVYFNGVRKLSFKKLLFDPIELTKAGFFTERTVVSFDDFLVKNLNERMPA